MRTNRWIALQSHLRMFVMTRMTPGRQLGTTALAVDFDRVKIVANHTLKV